MLLKAFLLALLLICSYPSDVLAGWLFGPSDKDECIEEYAKEAASKRLVGAVYQNCGRAFDNGLHSSSRKSAMCIVKGIGELKTEQAYRSLSSRCERENPAPKCPPGQKFNDRRNGCECDEMHGFVYEPAGKRCIKACEAGHYFNRQDGMCHLRFYGD